MEHIPPRSSILAPVLVHHWKPSVFYHVVGDIGKINGTRNFVKSVKNSKIFCKLSQKSNFTELKPLKKSCYKNAKNILNFILWLNFIISHIIRLRFQGYLNKKTGSLWLYVRLVPGFELPDFILDLTDLSLILQYVRVTRIELFTGSWGFQVIRILNKTCISIKGCVQN